MYEHFDLIAAFRNGEKNEQSFFLCVHVVKRVCWWEKDGKFHYQEQSIVDRD